MRVHYSIRSGPSVSLGGATGPPAWDSSGVEQLVGGFMAPGASTTCTGKVPYEGKTCPVAPSPAAVAQAV